MTIERRKMKSKYKTIIFGNDFFGGRRDGKAKVDNKWIPVLNTRYRNGKRGRHTATCPHCESKVKNINLHYRKYHYEWFKKFIIDPLDKGQIGEISGVRFFQSKKLVNEFTISNSNI